MQLIDQHTKKIMEGCKERARSAGLSFENETLEYIVTNRDLLELSPKVMIPTLYDYWVHDVEVLKEKGKYELYPTNPYETVINTRPAISFYNDNNPDWLNVMIFYHVLAHIDFFQNNLYFRNTWDFDLNGQALADKRLFARLRSEHGHWVDYIIEFARGIDNLVGYHDTLAHLFRPDEAPFSRRIDYYFDVFLQTVKKVRTSDYIRELERYNACLKKFGEMAEQTFFAEAFAAHPELEALMTKELAGKPLRRLDVMQYIMEESPFLNSEENLWMKSVVEVVRSTSLYFQPQIRTKIMNEGWASYWHEKLFLEDDRISGHEVDFARVHAGVTSLPRVGTNPYALGMRLFTYIEEMADRGGYSWEYQRMADVVARREYDRRTGTGRDFIFRVREDFCDYTFLTTFLDQDFVTRHRLFVTGTRLNRERMTMEYFVKSRKVEEYRQMLLENLYHPPHITVDGGRTTDGSLYLVHHFEEKPLVEEFIANTMLGIEYLWGGTVHLETNEPAGEKGPPEDDRIDGGTAAGAPAEIVWQRVLYTMEGRKLSKKLL